MRFFCLLVAAFLGPAVVPALAASVGVTRADADGVVFHYEPGPLRQIPVESGEKPAWRLEFEGTIPVAEPGEPFLPVRTERILLPLEGGYRLDFTTSGERTIEGAGLHVASPSGDAPHAGFAPSVPHPVVSSAVEVFRGRRILLVSLRPAIHDPVAGTVVLHERIDVSVRFDGGRRGSGAALGPDPVFDGIWNSVLNPVPPDAAGRTLVRPVDAMKPGSSTELPPDYFDDSSDWYKIRITRNGLFRLTGADLAQAGIPAASIDPSTVRLFAGSGMALSETQPESEAPGWGERGGFREIAILVNQAGTPDGKFDPADELLFYGLGPDNFRSWYDPALPETWYEDETTNENVYWLTWGGSFSGVPLRMASVAGPAEGRDVTVVREKLHFEKNDPTLFDPLPQQSGVRWEKWWWQRIEDNGSMHFWDLALDNPDTTQGATLFARWWGATWPNSVPGDPERKHYLSVNVNGGPDRSVSWGGTIRDARFDMTIENVVPKPVTRVIASVLRIPAPPGITRIDQILLGWFEITYRKRLSLAGHRLWFEGEATETGPVRFTITDAAAGALVLDVTEPWAPTLPATNRNGTTLTLTVASGAGRRYCVIAPAGIAKPLGLERDKRPTRWLRDRTNAADYLVIAHDDFMEAAVEIANWRRTRLRGITEMTDLAAPGVPPRDAKTMTVKVSDIYDEFSGGRVDPTAIRNFLQYAYSRWANAPDAPLSYVFLIGDANRDTRNYEESQVGNLLPSWQNGFDWIDDSTNPQYSSDDYFGRMEGPDDRLTDLVIGRLPVTTGEEALAVVRTKIIASETLDRVNPGRGRAVLVADDICQGGHRDPIGTGHMEQSESVDALVPREFDRKKVYLYDYGQDDCSILFKPSAKRDLIVAMNEGSWLVNYIGHGGDQQMADEKVLEVADVASISNLQSLPVLVAASCSIGKFDRSGSDGLAEVLVRSRTGGCIATMAATHLSFAGENGGLNNSIVRTLFPAGDNRSATVGLALFQAKNREVAAGTIRNDRQKKYLLIGDPASVLPAPAQRIRFDAFPDTLFRGTTATVTGVVLDRNGEPDTGFSGTLDLRVFDQPEVRRTSGRATYTIAGATLFSGRAAVSGGSFSSTFVVPVSLRGGPAGRIRAYVSGGGVEALGALSPVPILGTAPTGADTTAPRVELSLPGSTRPGATVRAIIEDESGINLTRLFEFRSVLFTVTDESDVERFRADVTDRFAYDDGSYRKGALETVIPEVPAGRYTFRLTATDNFNNRGEGTLEVQVGGAGAVTGVSEVYALPNPFAAATDITYTLDRDAGVRASIFSVSGRKVMEWTLDGLSGENRIKWDGRDRAGDAVANGVYLVRISARPRDGGKITDVVEPIVRIR